MFLTAYNLPHYLLSKGLIDSRSLVEGDFAIAEAGRRNRNFKVLRHRSPGLFVKQIKTTEAQAIHTVEREAAFYRAVHGDPKYARLQALIPKFIDYDARRHALALGLADNSESLQERQMRESQYRDDTAHALGRALAVVHSHGAAMMSDAATRPLFTCQLPWPLTFDQTGYQMFESFGPIGRALAAGIRQFPTLQPLLSALRAEWRYDSLIHNDMKWDNCLLKIQAEGEPELTIVDWELADIGDGAWDVATIFKDYIMAVFMNSSAREMAAAQQYPAPPPVTLETMHPSVRAFWEAYESGRGLSGIEAHITLLRAIRLTAGRMIIAVLEYLGGAAELGPFGNSMLQTSAGLLEAPHVAMAQLLGSTPIAVAA
jgi:aminoglycoside phosphotransferase (APT) family kinase protein